MSEEREARKRAFNGVAERYRDHRPGYPREVADFVAATAGLTPASRVLEVGCGPGNASRPFVERGCRFVGIDLGPDLVALAAAEFADHPNARFIAADFETWEPDERGFDLAFSASAFHWLDPATRMERFAGLLAPGGWLAILYNEQRDRDEAFAAAVREVYRRHVGERKGPPPGRAVDPAEPGAARFSPPVRFEHPFDVTLDADGYLALLGTYSDHILLEPGRREALFADLRDLVDRRFGGRVVKRCAGSVEMRRRVDG